MLHRKAESGIENARGDTGIGLTRRQRRFRSFAWARPSPQCCDQHSVGRSFRRFVSRILIRRQCRGSVARCAILWRSSSLRKDGSRTVRRGRTKTPEVTPGSILELAILRNLSRITPPATRKHIGGEINRKGVQSGFSTGAAPSGARSAATSAWPVFRPSLTSAVRFTWETLYISRYTYILACIEVAVGT
jgi:hypothetical protein